jgi:hypothetical protein
VKLAVLALLAAQCTGAPVPPSAPPPDPPVAPVNDPAACAPSCAKAQDACASPKPIDVCMGACQQAAPDLEGSLDELAVLLTCNP